MGAQVYLVERSRPNSDFRQISRNEDHRIINYAAQKRPDVDEVFVIAHWLFGNAGCILNGSLSNVVVRFRDPEGLALTLRMRYCHPSGR